MLLKTNGGDFSSPLAEREYRASPERMRTDERARLKSSGIPSIIRERREIRQVELTLTLDLKRRDTQKLKEGPADFCQGRMKDVPIRLAETKITFLEEEAAFEVLKERKVPGKFQLGSVQFRLDGQDMGIRRLIAVFNLRHLPRKLDRDRLERTLSFRPEKVIRNVWNDDPEGDEFLSFCDIEGARGCLGFHSHPFGPDIINPSLGLDPYLRQFNKEPRNLEILCIMLSFEVEVQPLRLQNV